VARELDCASVAFPAISTSVYGYPVERAAPVAVAAVREVLRAPVELVRFVLFSDDHLAAFARAVAETK
jgi:O-acetyl-ADP-ribose deacetylase (regulator of RNase III)